jgi:hypothetical protein
MKCIQLSVTIFVAVHGLTASAITWASPDHSSLAAADVKTYKVVLSKSSESKNRTIYVQARDSSEARQIAKDQNPGWQVELVSESK